MSESPPLAPPRHRRWLTRSRRVWLWSLLLGLLAAAATAGVDWFDRYNQANWVNTLSLSAYDTALNLLIATRGTEPARESPVVLVPVNQRTEQQLQTAMPFPRSFHAVLLRQLKRLGVRVVAFDMVFSPGSPEDAELAAAIRDCGRVVLACDDEVQEELRGEGQERYVTRRLNGAVPALRAAAVEGWVRLPKDADDAIRRFQWYTDIRPVGAREPVLLPAFAAAASALYWGQDPATAIRGVDSGRFGSHRVTLVEEPEEVARAAAARNPAYLDTVGGPTSYIDYVGPAGRTLPMFPYEEVVTLGEVLPGDGPVSAEQLARVDRRRLAGLRGKVAVVGVFSNFQDIYKSPVSSPETRRPQMAGYEIQANAIHTILAGDYIRSASERAQWWLLVSTCLLVALVTRRLNPITGLLATGVVVVILTASAATLMAQWRFWFDPVRACLGIVFAYAFEMAFLQATERRHSAEIRSHFGRQVGQGVVQEVLREDRDLAIGGQTCEVTLLFSDLKGFTTFSERLSAPALVTLLNRYFDAMVPILDRHGAMLDKIMGDGIMAYFGAPANPWPDHARRALQCALEMQAAMEQFRQETTSEGLPPLVMRIGVHTGAAVAGLIGSRERSEYSIMGDVVNVASRLEGMNKEFGTTILISEATCEAAQPAEPVTFRGEATVRGRAQPIRVYSIGPLQPFEEGNHPAAAQRAPGDGEAE
jgi:adenylate cyclase